MLVYAITPEIEAMTRRNVATLLENTTGDFEVRVLINGGPVVSFPEHPRQLTLYMAEPQSIAAGYNLAFSRAKGDVLACVHNDVTVPEGWNEPLQADLALYGGCVFPRLLEDASEIASRGLSPSMSAFPPSCCFLMRKALYEAVGAFDEVFEGCHFEDTDFWMRVLAHGEPLTRSEVTIWHGRGKTRTALVDGGNNSFRRNQQIYINRYRQPDGSVPLPSVTEITYGIHREQQGQVLQA